MKKNFKDNLRYNPSIEHMSDLDFRAMAFFMALEDFFYPTLDRRIATFGLADGMTVVDYGCGPGRYTTRYAKIVGSKGKVYAVDVQPLALEYVKRKAAKQNLNNIEFILAKGYQSGLHDHFADAVCALDIFFGMNDPTAFLKEIHRITKPTGFLIVDDSHQSRSESLQKIKESGYWSVAEESRDHLKCLPLKKRGK